MTGGDLNGCTRNTELLGEKANQLVVGRAIDRGCGDPDFDGVAMTSSHSRPSSSRHDGDDEASRQVLTRSRGGYSVAASAPATPRSGSHRTRRVAVRRVESARR